MSDSQSSAPSEGAQRFNTALAARIAAAKKLVQNTAPSAPAPASAASPSVAAPAAAAAAASAAGLPSYVPRSQQNAVQNAPMYPVMAKVVPIAIGLVVGLGIGALTTWFHPAQSRMVSLAGAPFILYFCFIHSGGGSTGSGAPRLAQHQLIALLNDPNVSAAAKNKAVADEYSAVAEQYVKYGLAAGFMLSLLWTLADVAAVSVWWTKNGEALSSAVGRSFGSSSAIQFFIIASGIAFVLYRRRDQAQQYLSSKFSNAAAANGVAAAIASAGAAGPGAASKRDAAVADRDATAGTNLAALSGSGSGNGGGDANKTVNSQRRKGGRRK